ncbi:MAG: hypothetical protein IT168_31325 [Bryobacterales bacterium]|nr:hypothetical protein [Bryobacterales bacterium]
MSYLLLICLIAGCAAGAYQSARLGLADWLYRRNTIEALRRSAEIWPARSEPYQRLAQLLPDEADGYLKTAIQLNPHYAKGWYDLGLRTEISGNYAAAEQMLLRAAQHDRRFLPAWTLSNFYFRRNQPDKFWIWARQAAEMSFTDLRPLFRLAMEFTQDPGQIADRIVTAPRPQRDFLYFLTEENMLEQAQPVAERIVRNLSKDDQPIVLFYSERQLFAGRQQPAIDAWNALARAGLIPHAELSVEKPLTNPAFEFPLLSLDRAPAFDWRLVQPEGVNVVPTAPSVRVSFSGKQPEVTELLWQFVPLAAGRVYKLEGEQRSTDIRRATNVRWKLISSVAGQAASHSPYFAPHEDWTPFLWEIHTPAEPGAWRLVLEQARESGTTRPTGSFHLRALALKPL